MKKIISIVLLTALMLSLFAFSGCKKEEETKTLQVGFAREDITPTGKVIIAGGGNDSRVSTEVQDYLYVTCVAITDAQDNTVLLITQDTVNSSKEHSLQARDNVSKATGVPLENIIISATHTHSSGKLLSKEYDGQTFTAEYYKKVVVAATKAMEDRSPAKVSMGTTHAENMVFVRRYVLDDDTIQGARGNTSTSTQIKGHVWDANDALQIIRFTREAEGKKDILMTNLGAHATFNGATTKTALSADFPAGIRDYVEFNENCHVAYFISAAGDQTPTTDIRSEDHRLNYFAYGEKIGEIICDYLPNLKPVGDSQIKVVTQTLTANNQKSDPEKLEEAQELWNLFQEQGFAVAEKAAKEAGFAGIYDARAVVNHASLLPTRDITGTVISLGDIAITAMPYEMHGGSAADLVSRSAYKENTFIMTCANGAEGYIPDQRGYDIGTYEAYTSFVEPGTGEKLVDMYVDMLAQLKG